MPGGRLAHEDRRQIAEWLVEGLGYAEIARRLGRPTSTISREVGRNGGLGGYRADRAQLATGDRARRRRPTSADPPADGRPAEAERVFVEQFAAMLAGTGMPRMPARVFTCLITSESGSLTAADLVRRLGVSPASISKAIGYLAEMELLRRESDPGVRRERYVVDDDTWIRVWRADTGAHSRVAEIAQRGVDLFGADSAAGTRLGQMGGFFDQVSREMSGSGLTDATERDARTVLAALVHAGRPLAVGDLATALGWKPERTADALNAIEHRPVIADPLALERIRPDTYAVVARPDRLTRAQREALR